jgi:hypothetical protein
MQRKRDGVWKRILALPLCACLLVSCSMRAVRVQNPVLSSGQEAPTVEPATQSWESVAFIPVVSSVEVDLTTGETITGRFRSADEREFVLEQDGLLRRVSRAEIRRVVLYQGRHTGRGALWGLGIGAASGLTVGIRLRPASDPVVLPVTLFLSGVGAAIGALLGTLVRKRAVIYEVP